MNDRDQLAEHFEAHRAHLQALAVRLLGSPHDAEDAVQEAWLRLNRSDAAAVDNLGGWLTTVVGRICLDRLRSRASKAEIATDELPEPDATHVAPPRTPEDEALLADTVGLALLVVLDTLTPAERLALVLHDMFAVPFEEIAPIVGRTPTAARQLASRARRRVQRDPTAPPPYASDQQDVVAAFLAAARDGDFAALMQLLDPDVVLRADPVAVAMAGSRAGSGAPELHHETRGADAVVRVFAGRARAARLVVVDGLAGAVWAPGGDPRVVFTFVVREGRVASIELLADPETLGGLELEL